MNIFGLKKRGHLEDGRGRQRAGIKENAEKQMTEGIPYVKNLALYPVGN